MNTTKHTLFTDVSHFYQNMITALEHAERTIHMIYFAFDDGEFPD